MTTTTAAIRSAVTACALTVQRLGDQLRHLAALLDGDGVDIEAVHRTGARQARDLELKAEEVRGLPAALVAELSAAGQAVAESAPKASPKRDSRPRPSARIFNIGAKEYTLQQLADMAGCSWAAMYYRLNTHDPAAAVAMGAANPKRYAKPSKTVPAQNPSTSQMQRPTPTRFNPDLTPPRLAADAEVIVPPNVKRTVAPTPPGRFDPRPGEAVPPLFSSLGPGLYFTDRRGDA